MAKMVSLVKTSLLSYLIPILLIIDGLLTALIIYRVPYTEIDWSTYLQQARLATVEGIQDYSKIEGDSGPCVYPAGFLWIFGLLRWACGEGESSVRTGQIIFGAIYLATVLLLMRIYKRAGVNSMWPYCLLVLSRRIHSIYVLRMFNDCITMFILYGAVYMLLQSRYKLASVFYSLSVSVKMNTLLFLPAFLLIVFGSGGVPLLFSSILIISFVQVLVGLPFLVYYPREYLTKAFDFNRQFLYKWTVNWRFVPESLFTKSSFGKTLLAAHAAFLLLWAYLRAFKRVKWDGSRKADSFANLKLNKPFSTSEKLTLLAEANLIGIIYARSLHYQFYSWYFHLIPFMLWRGRLWRPLAFVVFIGIERSWNVFPSTEASSFVLLALNCLLLISSLLCS